MMEALLMNPRKKGKKSKRNGKKRASKKQLAARAKFAKIMKSGGFKKAKKNPKRKGPGKGKMSQKQVKVLRMGRTKLFDKWIKHGVNPRKRKHTKRNPMPLLNPRRSVRRHRRNPAMDVKKIAQFAIGGALGLYAVPLSLTYVKKILSYIPVVKSIDLSGKYQSIALKLVVGGGAGYLVMNKTKYKNAGKALIAGTIANIILKEFVPSVGTMIGLSGIEEMGLIEESSMGLIEEGTGEYEDMGDMGEDEMGGIQESGMSGEMPELEGMENLTPYGMSDIGAEEIVL